MKDLDRSFLLLSHHHTYSLPNLYPIPPPGVAFALPLPHSPPILDWQIDKSASGQDKRGMGSEA